MDDRDRDLAHIDPRLREVYSCHLGEHGVCRVELLVDCLVRNVATRQVGSECDRTLLGNAGDRLNRVGDTGEVERLEVEGLVWRGWGESWSAIQNTVGDSIGCYVDAGLRLDASGDDARDTLLENVPGVIFETFVGANWIDLGDGRDRGQVVVGGKLRDRFRRGDTSPGRGRGKGQEGERSEACELHGRRKGFSTRF